MQLLLIIMLEALHVLPPTFWLTALLICAGGASAMTKMRAGIGLPMLTVLGTVTSWYVGDAFYNDYAQNHVLLFTGDLLESAWLQVAWFVAVFLLLAPMIHRSMNHSLQERESFVYQLMKTGADDFRLQLRFEKMFWGAAVIWMVLVGIAFCKLGDQMFYYFFPYLGYKADPWGRGRLGQGLDAVWTVAGYVQMFVAMVFGVTAALARRPIVRNLALIGCVLLWPFYIFDRVRNVMLAVMVPGILAWVFIRIRASWLVKLAVLAGCFGLINSWFAFVIANRSDTSIVAAIHGEATSGMQESAKTAHHEGMNMFEELCWINQFIQTGAYNVNWGKRYFAEIVNPIPRTLWPGKPLIGIDYAAARGQSGSGETDNTDASGVYATISTGMIGQGEVNFGRFLGPAFAAFLMSLWAALLARLDLRGDELGNLPLYALGLILTYNLGRDITLITLYTFFFGWGVVWWVNRRNSNNMTRMTRNNRSPQFQPGRQLHPESKAAS